MILLMTLIKCSSILFLYTCVQKRTPTYYKSKHFPESAAPNNSFEHNHRTTYRRKSILPQHTTAAPGQWLNKNEQIGPWTLKVQAIPKKHACERNADSKTNVQRMGRDTRLRRRQGKGVRNMAHRHKVCRNNAMYSTTFHQRQDVLLFKSHL
jgi:hypothetical protein